MRIQLKLIVLSLLLPISVFAQNGKKFPSIEGETLKDRKVVLPQDTKGKYTLIAVAYSKKSDELLKGWYSPMYRTFVEPPEVAFIPTDDYDVNMYFVALLKGIYKVADNKISNKMKSGIDAKFHKNMVIYTGKINDYKKQLNLGQKDLPYFFVLDKNGNIVYHTQGAYSDKKLYEIQSAIETE
ncbi:hypothetical protein [Chondrinema litorale]|uniref:hypothetical protein n=1 Tax=Chondrinema litorale TaxID=2994555 RepID=UPI002543B81C|nr:hypothetical protein [Chondrinema litorale]UZR94627.1 hypothetical protein OQ292_02180 [Chondrinema litorale]